MKIKLNKTGLDRLRNQLANSLTDPLDQAAEVARSIAPVDTSSLQQSIRSGVQISGDKIIGIVAAGGEDFADTYFASTGEMGNYVDYADEQEAIHGFMEAAMGEIVRELT